MAELELMGDEQPIAVDWQDIITFGRVLAEAAPRQRKFKVLEFINTAQKIVIFRGPRWHVPSELHKMFQELEKLAGQTAEELTTEADKLLSFVKDSDYENKGVLREMEEKNSTAAKVKGLAEELAGLIRGAMAQAEAALCGSDSGQPTQ